MLPGYESDTKEGGDHTQRGHNGHNGHTIIILCDSVQLHPRLSLVVLTQQSYCHGTGIRCPSANSGFSEVAGRIRPNLREAT